MSLLNGANGNYNSAYNTSLNAQMGLLNHQQGLAMDANNTGQFARGQLGTTGGGLQTTALAQGFGLADLQAQQNAVSQGLAAQQTAYSGANTAAGGALSVTNSGVNGVGIYVSTSGVGVQATSTSVLCSSGRSGTAPLDFRNFTIE